MNSTVLSRSEPFSKFARNVLMILTRCGTNSASANCPNGWQSIHYKKNCRAAQRVSGKTTDRRAGRKRCGVVASNGGRGRSIVRGGISRIGRRRELGRASRGFGKRLQFARQRAR